MNVLALTGGIGGAKLALGLSRVLDWDSVTFVVNTGDDFEHFGLLVCPDIDTLIYTLAGIQNPQTGWGRAAEHWNCMETLADLGAETWFRLGDSDLATHLLRNQLLRERISLTKVTQGIAERFGVRHKIVPMSDQPVRTIVETEDGDLAFQQYFVREKCVPRATGFRFDGAARAQPSPQIGFAAVDAVVICPSNPFVSIDPILSVAGMKQRIRELGVPVVAVSPIVGGRAIKGPTAKMMQEMGMRLDATSVAQRYRDVITGFVLDSKDRSLAGAVESMGVATTVQHTVMVSLHDREALARNVLSFVSSLA